MVLMHEHDHRPLPVPAQRRPTADDLVTTVRSTQSALLDVRVVFASALPMIRLRGDLDLSNVHQLRDAVDSLVTTSIRGDLVVLDVHDLRFCDGQGLAAFDEARRKFAEVGKELVLQNPSDMLRKLFHIAGVEWSSRTSGRPFPSLPAPGSLAEGSVG
jgi:anti-sigma B factor antagonist